MPAGDSNGLRDRVVTMIVALGTADGEAEEGGETTSAFRTQRHSGQFWRRLPCGSIRRGSQKAGCREQLGLLRRGFGDIPGELAPASCSPNWSKGLSAANERMT
jgi:hypothetical protein